jgi:hypothetical protein
LAQIGIPRIYATSTGTCSSVLQIRLPKLPAKQEMIRLWCLQDKQQRNAFLINNDSSNLLCRFATSLCQRRFQLICAAGAGSWLSPNTLPPPRYTGRRGEIFYEEQDRLRVCIEKDKFDRGGVPWSGYEWPLHYEELSMSA